MIVGDYHKDRKYLSSSQLKLLMSDPMAHYKQYILNEPQEPKDYYDFGTYIHALILEPDTIESKFVISPGMERKGPGWEALVAANPDKICLTKVQEQQARNMLALCNKNTVPIHTKGQLIEVPFASLFQRGTPEDTHLMQPSNGHMGIKVRCDYRGDFLSTPTIFDIKTTSETLNDKNIAKICALYKYELSAALYRDVVYHSTGVEHDYVFVFINKAPKSEQDVVRVVRASDAFLNRGRRLYHQAVVQYELCKKNNSWVGLMEVG